MPNNRQKPLLVTRRDVVACMAKGGVFPYRTPTPKPRAPTRRENSPRSAASPCAPCSITTRRACFRRPTSPRGGRRVYTEADAAKLRKIVLLKPLGLKLADIRFSNLPPRTARCARWPPSRMMSADGFPIGRQGGMAWASPRAQVVATRRFPRWWNQRFRRSANLLPIPGAFTPHNWLPGW